MVIIAPKPATAALPEQTPKSFSRHLRGSRYLPRRLRRPRGAPGICRDVCAGCAGFPAFAETFARAARGSGYLPKRLRDSRKHQKVSCETCGTPANAKKFFVRLAGLPQTPKSFSRDLRGSRKHQKVFRETCGAPANTHYSVKMSVRWRLAFFLTQGAGT